MVVMKLERVLRKMIQKIQPGNEIFNGVFLAFNDLYFSGALSRPGPYLRSRSPTLGRKLSAFSNHLLP